MGHAPGLSPALPLLGPLRDQALVSASGDAEVSSGPGLRLVEVVACVESGQEPRHLGQQRGPVVPPGQDLPQLGHCGGRLGLGRLAPPGVPLDSTMELGDDQPIAVTSATILSHLARIEHENEKDKIARPVSALYTAGKYQVMEALTPASADDLPPLGELVADVPFWRYPSAALAGEGIARLRVWLTAAPEPGHLAVVTGTGSAASVTESVRRIWAGLTRRYGPSLVLLEHSPAPDAGEGMETLDLVRIGADGSPHWTRIWPTPEDNPRHAELELWMPTYGHQIVSRSASCFDWCAGEKG
jgi:hypothetical protein